MIEYNEPYTLCSWIATNLVFGRLDRPCSHCKFRQCLLPRYDFFGPPIVARRNLLCQFIGRVFKRGLFLCEACAFQGGIVACPEQNEIANAPTVYLDLFGRELRPIAFRFFW